MLTMPPKMEIFALIHFLIQVGVSQSALCFLLNAFKCNKTCKYCAIGWHEKVNLLLLYVYNVIVTRTKFTLSVFRTKYNNLWQQKDCCSIFVYVQDSKIQLMCMYLLYCLFKRVNVKRTGEQFEYVRVYWTMPYIVILS